MPDPVVVTELRESPRAPGRYRVVLSSGEEFLVGLTTLSELGATRTGAVIGPDQMARLQHAAAVTALVDRGLNTLARGRRTRRELEQRFRRIETDRTRISEALDRLEASGALSDEEVARAEAASRLRRGEAPARVQQQLRRKGIDAKGTAEAIARATEAEGFDEVESCRRQAEKRLRSLGSLEPSVARRRLVAYLQRRGFGGSVIRMVLDELPRH